MAQPSAQVKTIFGQALEIESPNERCRYLDEACGGDAALRAEVQELLAAMGNAGDFLVARARDPAPTQALSSLEKPGTQIGPYKLLQVLGEGGMGTVFMAEQKEPVKRRVALKIIKPGMDTQQVIARFEAERQALAMMEHPNIARVLDAGTTESGRPFFVMELVKGMSLSQYCDEQHLTPRQRLELFVPICQAVQHAHQKGIIHRDLKPSNILVAEYDHQPVPKIIDFGVAKAVSQTLTEKTIFTQYGQIVGTLEYMSPEQAKLNQLDIDTRSDIYSLGVILYELLTGTTPFDRHRLRSAAFDELLRIIRDEEPPRPSTRLSTMDTLASIAANRRIEPQKLGRMLRGELDWIVMKSLEKDRARRYETANSMAADLQRYLNDEPVVACPPSAGYRFRKFARRNKAVFTTGITVAAALLFGIIGTTWQAIRATTEARRASKAEQLAHDRYESERKARDAADKLRMETEAARAAEQQQREIAQQQAAISSAVNRFLQQDLLLQADTANQLGDGQSRDRDVKVGTLLERAAKAIGERFADQPQVEAAIRQIIGQTYYSLGLWTEGREHLERALEIRRGLFGEAHPDTLETMESLAPIYQHHGPSEKAEPLLGHVLETRQKSLGDQHPSTLTSMHLLASYHWYQGNYAVAEPLILQTLTGRQQFLGESHPDTLFSQSLLALLYDRMGKYEKSEPIFLKVWELQRSVLGEDHRFALWTAHSLAHSYLCQNRIDEAEALAENVLELQLRVLGPEDPYTLLSMLMMGNIHLERNRWVDAAQILEKAVAGMKHRMSEHRATPGASLSLARAYQELGEFDKAALLLEECRAIYDRHLRDQPAAQGGLSHDAKDLHARWVLSHIELGHVLKAQERLDEASACYRRAVELDPTNARANHAWGNLLQAQGKLDEAIVCYEQATKSDPNLSWSFFELGKVFQAQGRLDEAIACYSSFITLQPSFGWAHHNLGKALNAQGKLSEASVCYRRAIEVDPKNVHAHLALANALNGQGKFDEASVWFTKSLDVDPKNPLAVNNVAWVLATCQEERLRDPARAVELARQAVALAPMDSSYRNTLGVAHFRAGNWTEAIPQLQKSIELSQDGLPYNCFFLAMAHWQLGEKNPAREWYDKAVRWMDANQPKDEQLLRFRAESTELLGLTTGDGK